MATARRRGNGGGLGSLTGRPSNNSGSASYSIFRGTIRRHCRAPTADRGHRAVRQENFATVIAPPRPTGPARTGTPRSGRRYGHNRTTWRPPLFFLDSRTGRGITRTTPGARVPYFLYVRIVCACRQAEFNDVWNVKKYGAAGRASLLGAAAGPPRRGRFDVPRTLYIRYAKLRLHIKSRYYTIAVTTAVILAI